MQRRSFVCACAGAFSLFHATQLRAQWTDRAVGSNNAPTPTPTPSEDRAGGHGTIRGLQGCYLAGSSDGGPPQFRLSRTTGNQALDVGLTNEFGILSQYFGATPGFFMYDDGGAGNAFATSQTIGGHSFPHGTVCFGLTLMSQEFAAAPMGRGDHVMVAIMAHEWGHILQFRRLSRPVPGKAMELQADFLAGWYMGVRSSQVFGGVDLVSSMRSFFGKGDYQFNSPSHHGRPEERAAAFQQGLSAGVRGASTAQAFEVSARANGLS